LTNAPTRDHFKHMIEILAKIIPHPSSSYDTNMLVLNWLLEIIDLISIDYANILETYLFSNLFGAVVTAAYSNEQEV
jgi:hypothetical protein